jgi:hypothetical protein
VKPREFLAQVKKARATAYPEPTPASEFLRLHLEQLKEVGAEFVNLEEFFDDYLTELFAVIVRNLPPKQQRDVTKRIAVGTLGNSRINAFIVRSSAGECFAILLNRALLATINHYVKLIAAANHPDAVIYCDGRSPTSLSKKDYLRLIAEMLRRYATTGEPRGPELKLALGSNAMAFVDEALRATHVFVLAHELGHYLNGDLTVRGNFARSDEAGDALVFRSNLSHNKEFKADEVAFDLVLRALRSVRADYRARRALDLSVILFFNFVREISNRGSESHPAPGDRLVALTRAFFGTDAADTMARSFNDLSQVAEFRSQVDHLSVAEVLRTRDGDNE